MRVPVSNIDFEKTENNTRLVFVSPVELEHDFISLRIRKDNTELLLPPAVALELSFGLLDNTAGMNPEFFAGVEGAFFEGLAGKLRPTDYLDASVRACSLDDGLEFRTRSIGFPSVIGGTTGVGNLRRLNIYGGHFAVLRGVNGGGGYAGFISLHPGSAANLSLALAHAASNFIPDGAVGLYEDRALTLFRTGVDPSPVENVTGFLNARQAEHARQQDGINVDDLLPPRI